MTRDGEKQETGRQSIFTEDESPLYFGVVYCVWAKLKLILLSELSLVFTILSMRVCIEADLLLMF